MPMPASPAISPAVPPPESRRACLTPIVWAHSFSKRLASCRWPVLGSPTRNIFRALITLLTSSLSAFPIRYIMRSLLRSCLRADDHGVGVMVMDAFHIFAFHLEPDDALILPEFVRDRPGHVFGKARPGIGLFSHLFFILALEQGIQP